MRSQFNNVASQKSVFQRKDKTKKLAEAAKTLNFYLLQLKSNDRAITMCDHQALGVILNGLKSAKGSDLEYIRTTLMVSLEALMATVDLLRRYNDLLTQYQTTLTRAKILDNVDSILEYLKQIKVSLFPDAVITVIKAEIRKEYAIYIQRYGPPKDGLFNLTLLANIMAEI